MDKPWMRSDSVPRCESCGLRLEDPTAALCKTCAYRRKKQEQKAAADAQAQAQSQSASEPAPQATGPDVNELRERLRRVEEGLRE